VTVEYTVISIGTLSRNRLWGEGQAVRTAHATTTLIAEAGRLILVDPSLPGPVLDARLHERTGKRVNDITDVFCTTLRPAHRRGVTALPQATWWCSQLELEGYTQGLEAMQQTADRLADDADTLAADRKLLAGFQAAPQKFGEQISLYPTPGPSPGATGLLLTPATQTIVIAGDAAVTAEHVQRGQVWGGCVDVQAAMQSLTELLELADLIVCGHDNLMLLPRTWL